jgi:hypothetical protein
MIKITINNNSFFADHISYYSNGLSPLSSFTISGLKENIETLCLEEPSIIWINDSIFLTSFTVVSFHNDEINNNIIIFGKDENYDC